MTSSANESASLVGVGDLVLPTAADVIKAYDDEIHDRPVTSAAEVPPSYESITPDWLTDVLCRRVRDAKVVSFEPSDRDDGSANRRRLVIHYNEAGSVAGLPASVFCKAGERLENRLAVGLSGVALAEASFYTMIRARLNIEAPKSYYCAFDPRNCAFMIMLTDLSGSATFCDVTDRLSWEQACGQMTLLAKMHAQFYESPELESSTIPFKTWQQSWRNLMTAMPLWGTYSDQAFAQTADLMPARLYQRRAEVWPATEASVRAHDRLPKTLIHCDTHIRNWYLTNTGTMGLLDWQVLSIGHWSRDVIYAMTTALTIDDRRQWEKELVRFYLEQLAAHGGPRVSEQDAWAQLKQQLLSALAFWTITLCPSPGMPDYHPQYRTREILKRLYAAIDDHAALDSF